MQVVSEQQAPSELQSEAKALRCNSCLAVFTESSEHRAHFRSEWHRHNLRRKIKHMQPVSQEEYTALSPDQICVVEGDR
jgi:hypothetical protein